MENLSIKLRQAFVSMHHRCSPDYYKSQYYYEKGIRVCSEWSSFDTFSADMGLPTTGDHSLDRIDNSKGYSKDNCRWATKSQQAYNRDSYTKNMPGITYVKFDAKRRVSSHYKVRFTREQKNYFVGNYKTYDEAMVASIAWRKQRGELSS